MKYRPLVGAETVSVTLPCLVLFVGVVAFDEPVDTVLAVTALVPGEEATGVLPQPAKDNTEIPISPLKSKE
ncbi:hypothetical protein D2Q93_04455 [Alicyclobacillaceae bacterium I2511]|nr:hypothetical protein D2Q93_04455 [Alicyclobacillaceae bacterium I2511]